MACRNTTAFLWVRRSGRRCTQSKQLARICFQHLPRHRKATYHLSNCCGTDLETNLDMNHTILSHGGQRCVFIISNHFITSAEMSEKGQKHPHGCKREEDQDSTIALEVYNLPLYRTCAVFRRILKIVRRNGTTVRREGLTVGTPQ